MTHRKYEEPLNLAGPLTIGRHLSFFSALALLAQLQMGVTVLNLLPVPGLDGWGALEPFLADDVVAFGRRVAMPAMLLLFLIVWNVPAANHALWYLPDRIDTSVGMPIALVAIGSTLMRFWDH
jgi:Zn-dependent protease